MVRGCKSSSRSSSFLETELNLKTHFSDFSRSPVVKNQSSKAGDGWGTKISHATGAVCASEAVPQLEIPHALEPMCHN